MITTARTHPEFQVDYDNIEDELFKTSSRMAYLGSALGAAKRKVMELSEAIIPGVGAQIIIKLKDQVDEKGRCQYTEKEIEAYKHSDPSYVKLKMELAEAEGMLEELKCLFQSLSKQHSALIELYATERVKMQKDSRNYA